MPNPLCRDAEQRSRERAASAALRERVQLSTVRFVAEIDDLLNVLDRLPPDELASVEEAMKGTPPRRRRTDI